MTLTGLLTTQLPLGRIILLAWLTATYLHFQHGVDFTIQNISPIQFALLAGLLFGYYIFFDIILRIIFLSPLLILMLYKIFRYKLRLKEMLSYNIDRKSKASKIGAIMGNVTSIIAMFVTFLLAPNQELLSRYAPIGLVFAFILFALGINYFKGKQAQD